MLKFSCWATKKSSVGRFCLTAVQRTCWRTFRDVNVPFFQENVAIGDLFKIVMIPVNFELFYNILLIHMVNYFSLNIFWHHHSVVLHYQIIVKNYLTHFLLLVKSSRQLILWLFIHVFSYFYCKTWTELSTELLKTSKICPCHVLTSILKTVYFSRRRRFTGRTR